MPNPIVMRNESSKSELKKMIEHLKKLKDCSQLILVEIGTFYGDSTIIFSREFKHVTTVDPFKSNIGGITDTMDMDEVYKEFCKRSNGIKNISLMKTDSANASTIVKDNSIDMVYIDGDHSYKSVKQDLELWSKKVKVGGWICGHDYRTKFPEVKKAVDEFFKRKPDALFLDGSFVFIKK